MDWIRFKHEGSKYKCRLVDEQWEVKEWVPDNTSLSSIGRWMTPAYNENLSRSVERVWDEALSKE